MIQDKNWYKNLFDALTESVVIVEPKSCKIVEANESAKKLLKLPENYNDLQLNEFKNVEQKIVKSDSGNLLSEHVFKINGEELNIEINAVLIEYEGKKLIQATLRNKQETDSLTERLIQADKLVLLGQLSAGVAHEIRNPLAAVNLNLQLLARKFAEGSNEFNSIQTALQGVDRISRIVEITLNFSKPSTPDIHEVDLNSIIPSSLDLVAAELKKKKIIVESLLDEKLPLIAADTKQMQQVLINLLTNAADSINGEGRIKIKTYVDEMKDKNIKNVVLSVEDNGNGISQEELAKVFNPFYTKKSNGTGLGLSISQRIVKEHKGKIEVISKVGEGSIFRVLLPVRVR